MPDESVSRMSATNTEHSQPVGIQSILIDPYALVARMESMATVQIGHITRKYLLPTIILGCVSPSKPALNACAMRKFGICLYK
jgi:hypothetical protein